MKDRHYVTDNTMNLLQIEMELKTIHDGLKRDKRYLSELELNALQVLNTFIADSLRKDAREKYTRSIYGLICSLVPNRVPSSHPGVAPVAALALPASHFSAHPPVSQMHTFFLPSSLSPRRSDDVTVDALDKLVGDNVLSNAFKQSIKNFLSPNYFTKSPKDRCAFLVNSREDQKLMALFAQYRLDTGIFLRHSVNCQPDLIHQLMSNRLGQHFLFSAGEKLARQLRYDNAELSEEILDILRLLNIPDQDLSNRSIFYIFNCQLTHSIILGRVAKIQIPKSMTQFFDYAELENWVKENGTNPVDGTSLSLPQLLDATDEYRRDLADVMLDNMGSLDVETAKEQIELLFEKFEVVKPLQHQSPRRSPRV